MADIYFVGYLFKAKEMIKHVTLNPSPKQNRSANYMNYNTNKLARLDVHMTYDLYSRKEKHIYSIHS